MNSIDLAPSWKILQGSMTADPIIQKQKWFGSDMLMAVNLLAATPGAVALAVRASRA